MEKEFNLSEEITPAYGWNDNTKVILAEDVKEFIRLLKEDFKSKIGETAEIIIDKLAGEKLNGN